jgi:hypothetical protein
MAYTQLKTQEFLDSYNALNKAKYPSHENRLAYVALATMLELCINWKYGINQTQKMLDEKSAQWKSELESLVK